MDSVEKVTSVPSSSTAGAAKLPAATGRARPVVSGIAPWIDGGHVALKRVPGDPVTLEADIFADGHDLVAATVRWRHQDEEEWRSAPMAPLGNDRFRGTFVVERTGTYRVTIRATIDRLGTWARAVRAKLDGDQDVTLDLAEGADLIAAAERRARGEDRSMLRRWEQAVRQSARQLATSTTLEQAVSNAGPEQVSSSAGPDLAAGHRLSPEDVLGLVDDHELHATAARCPDLEVACTVEAATVLVERSLAGCSAWYELFPRSASPDPARPGTLTDVVERLPYVAGLGFDVLYLPPIHPIGTTNRKGRDNSPRAAPGDPGSPWAIGSADGGHDAVHPELGTVADLRRLVDAARERGMEVALDLAWQCSPDHPWVTEHPQWFRRRPDGSIAHAENPPKRYEDVLPFDFETDDWRSLWEALADVVRYWIAQGIAVFRVDNPHTKPLRFWEWLIATVRAEAPEVIWLSEAFTRPRVMEHLAKVGFSQSYTYFTWRNAKWEIEQYLSELTSTDLAEYFRPSFWPNTPDILPEVLQVGGRGAFVARLVLAAMGSASYGIYGPVFELQEHVPRPGAEEYLGSEKYEVRHWDLDDPASLAPVVARVNAARRAHPALRQNRTLRLQRVDNEHLVAFTKTALTDDGVDVVLTVVNLDTRYPQSGWVDLDVDLLGVGPGTPLHAHDLLTDAHYEWNGPHNYVALDPTVMPAHVLHLERAVTHP